MDFENVLEVFVQDNVADPDAQPTHVVVFECKDYGRKIEVGKVDEIVGRLAGGYGFNLKGYLVTRKGFQSGALAAAKSHGIGLMKFVPKEQIQFFAYMSEFVSPEQEARQHARRTRDALLNPDYVSDGDDFYGLDGDLTLASFEEAVAEHLRKHARAPS